MEAEVNKAHGLYVAIRDENRGCATNLLATHQGKNEAMRTTTQELPKAGDLVLVRDTQLDNQRGRKLEARWRGLRILVQTTKENLSGWTKTLYSDGKLKRYHMQDLKKYIV